MYFIIRRSFCIWTDWGMLGLLRLVYLSDTMTTAQLVCFCVTAPVFHYDDVIMTMLASQITSLPVVCSIVYSGVNQRKHQSSASLAFVREIHRGPVNFPHKWPVTRKMFPFDDVIMWGIHLSVQKTQQKLLSINDIRLHTTYISDSFYTLHSCCFRVITSQITDNLAVCSTDCSG